MGVVVICQKMGRLQFWFAAFHNYNVPRVQIRAIYAADYDDNKEKYDSEPINAGALLSLLDELTDDTLDGYQDMMCALVSKVCVLDTINASCLN